MRKDRNSVDVFITEAKRMGGRWKKGMGKSDSSRVRSAVREQMTRKRKKGAIPVCPEGWLALSVGRGEGGGHPALLHSHFISPLGPPLKLFAR